MLINLSTGLCNKRLCWPFRYMQASVLLQKQIIALTILIFFCDWEGPINPTYWYFFDYQMYYQNVLKSVLSFFSSMLKILHPLTFIYLIQLMSLFYPFLKPSKPFLILVVTCLRILSFLVYTLWFCLPVILTNNFWLFLGFLCSKTLRRCRVSVYSQVSTWSTPPQLHFHVLWS